jgi:hypothetical protein
VSHITVAVSEKAFKELFKVFRDKFTYSKSDSANFAGFSASYSVALHLEDGTVDLQAGNKIAIKEVDIKWDQLTVDIGFDIPELCVGGWCIIPSPWGCVLRFPSICVFDKNPDIGISLDLSGIVTSEVSVTAKPVVKYRVDPARTPSMSNLAAEYAGIPNKWQIFMDPVTVDIDLFDIADIVGDLLENAVKAAINNILWFLPDFVKEFIWWILGPVIDLIRLILDLPDDIAEWFSNLLGVSFGLLNTITTVVGDYFAKKYPIYEFEDPFPILPASGVLIPVKISIKNFAVQVDENEMVIKADVGA